MTCTLTTYDPTRYTPGLWDYDMDFIVAPGPGGRHPDIYSAEIAHSDDEGRIASPRQQDANRRLCRHNPQPNHRKDTAMKKYHVSVAVQILEIYEIEADDPEAASDSWWDGNLIHPNDEALDSVVLSIKEV